MSHNSWSSLETTDNISIIETWQHGATGQWPGPSRELWGSPDFDGEMPLKCLLMSFQTIDTGLQTVKMSDFDVIIHLCLQQPIKKV